jgi:dihydroorotate dehydrogenase (NAD+) catalytic subunit
MSENGSAVGEAPLETPLAEKVANLATKLVDVQFPNPVFTASGCAAAGRELAAFCDVSELGAIVTKSVMRDARPGRPTPRMAETPSGMLNSIGLQGPGLTSFLQNDLPRLTENGARAIVSIAGGTVEEYAGLARQLRGVPGISMVEVNISCPNVANRGQVFACSVTAAADVLAAVRRELSGAYYVPLLAKLSPDVTDIVEIARSVVDAGADGLSLINTLLGMAIDPVTLRPALAGITGGLSGPAILPVALRCVYQVHAAMPSVPILGMGGIRTGADALAFIAAGASAVSVGTAVFGDPGAHMRIIRELTEELTVRRLRSIRDVIGAAHRPAGLPVPGIQPPAQAVGERAGELS